MKKPNKTSEYIYFTLYYLHYKDFLKALDELTAKLSRESVSAGVEMLEDFKEYFYIRIPRGAKNSVKF